MIWSYLVGAMVWAVVLFSSGGPKMVRHNIARVVLVLFWPVSLVAVLVLVPIVAIRDKKCSNSIHDVVCRRHGEDNEFGRRDER